MAVFVIRAPKSGFEMLIYLLVAVGLIFGTMDHRKGFAIGVLRAHSLLFDEEAIENKPNADRPSKRASRSEDHRL